MRRSVHFILDGRPVAVDLGTPGGLPPTTTVLNYLRSLPGHTGVKEGCAEGDCGACTVVLATPVNGRLHYRAVDSCLLFLPMLDGQQLITIENLRAPSGALHPVQEAMVRLYGSQCGFCTPGIVLSMFALYKEHPAASAGEIRTALAGNLCRCTGYQGIVDACADACHRTGSDHFSEDESRILHLLNTLPGEPLQILAPGGGYVRPLTISDALEYLRNTSGVTVVNGATDVALRVTKGHERLEHVLDLSAVEEMQALWQEDGIVVIGAGVPLCRVRDFSRERLPALHAMLDVFAARQIRNVATVGGNLGTASPIGDLPPVLIAHDAAIVAAGSRGERRIPAGEFFVGYRKTALGPGELITRVLVPVPDARTLLRSYKVSRRRDLDIATVSGGFRLELDERGQVARTVLAFGGMADRPARGERTEAFLTGRPWDRPTVEQAMGILGTEFTPISDVRGSAEFRSTAARNLLLKFWNETRSDSGGGRL
jgi:xanthine dehydrogenase small subunit